MLPMLAKALNGHALVPDGLERVPAGVGGPRCASAATVAGEDCGADSSGPGLAGRDGPLRAAAAPQRLRRRRLRLRRCRRCCRRRLVRASPCGVRGLCCAQAPHSAPAAQGPPCLVPAAKTCLCRRHLCRHEPCKYSLHAMTLSRRRLRRVLSFDHLLRHAARSRPAALTSLKGYPLQCKGCKFHIRQVIIAATASLSLLTLVRHDRSTCRQAGASGASRPDWSRALASALARWPS